MKQTNNFITGLVIKEEQYGEKAKLLHVLTSNDGVLRMKAPGAGNLKSSTHSSVQLFAYSEFSVSKGKNGYLTITGAVAKNNFFNIRNKIEKYALACYFSSAVECVTADITSADILRLILNCFYALSELNYSTETIKPIFEIKLASICGFTPDFDSCASCGAISDTYTFDIFSSGMLCEKCKKETDAMIKSHRYFELNPYCVNAIKYFCSCDLKQIFRLKITEAEKTRFRSFCEIYLCNIFAKTPKTLLFYNKLMRSIQDEKLRQKQENS